MKHIFRLQRIENSFVYSLSHFLFLKIMIKNGVLRHNFNEIKLNNEICCESSSSLFFLFIFILRKIMRFNPSSSSLSCFLIFAFEQRTVLNYFSHIELISINSYVIITSKTFGKSFSFLSDLRFPTIRIA